MSISAAALQLLLCDVAATTVNPCSHIAAL